jgi:hypothetical protein
VNGNEREDTMHRRLIFSFILGVIAFAALQAQEIQPVANSDSISNCSSYLFWVDGGKYPLLGNSHTGDFLPKYNMRLGIGKPFHFLQLFGFAEWTHYKFDPLDVLLPSGARRNDIALYGAVSAFQVFFFGLGAYYTHQDNITEPNWSWSAVTERGVRSYVHIYYLIGLGYQIGISNSISLPIGLYTWNYDYPRQEHWGGTTLGEKFSLRLGMIYTPFTSNAREMQPPDTANSLSNRSAYQIWVDGGVNPFGGNTYSGEFDPIRNVRLGIGRQFSIFQLFGFIELTNYQFHQADALLPPFEKSNKRQDIAFYGMGSLFRIISLGIGVHYTHEDKIILYDRPYRIISQSDARSYYGLYYLIGLGYPIKIFDGFSVPVGLYYHRARNDRVSFIYKSPQERTYFALQLGIIYTFEGNTP